MQMSNLTTFQKLYSIINDLIRGEVNESKIENIGNPLHLKKEEIFALFTSITSIQVVNAEIQEAYNKILNILRDQDNNITGTQPVFNQINAFNVDKINCDGQEGKMDTVRFFNLHQRSNGHRIGLSLMDTAGKFYLYDEMTREILECSKDLMAQNTIFQQMFKPSLLKILEEHSGLILNFNRNKIKIRCSVYSDRNRKKAFKYVSKFYKSIEHNQTQRSIRRNNNQHPIIDPSDEINCKYLKCLELTLKRVEVLMTSDCLNSFNEGQMNIVKQHVDLEDLCDGKVNNIRFQAMMCEIKEAEEFQKFTLDELMAEPKIQKYQSKQYSFNIFRKILDQDPKNKEKSKWKNSD